MTDKNPTGWCSHILAIDCETTGLCFKSDNPVRRTLEDGNVEEYQAISWGFVVARSDTLTPVEELYVEIKWNDTCIEQRVNNKKYGKRAEEVHGLSIEHLEEHGLTEEEAVIKIGSMILKYWGPDASIRLLGHNVATFDMCFLRDLFRRHGVELKFGNRQIDTSSAGFINFESYTSDHLFDVCGLDARNTHNALDDAKMALEAARTMRYIFKEGLKSIDEG